MRSNCEFLQLPVGDHKSHEYKKKGVSCGLIDGLKCVVF